MHIKQEDKEYIEFLYKKVSDQINDETFTKLGLKERILNSSSPEEFDTHMLEMGYHLTIGSTEEKILSTFEHSHILSLETYLKTEEDHSKIEKFYEKIRSVLVKFPIKCAEYITKPIFTGDFKHWLEKKYPEDYSRYYLISSTSAEWGIII